MVEEGRARTLRQRVLRGDQDAWRELFDAGFAAVCRYVRRRCSDTELAQEVVQESLWIAVRKIEAFDPHRAPWTHWLRGIAQHVLRNRTRREARSRTTPLDFEPVAQREDRDLLREVEHTLTALSPEHRRVLHERYREQRSVAEIAGRMDRSEKAVESLLTRARAAFRTAHRGNAPDSVFGRPESQQQDVLEEPR